MQLSLTSRELNCRKNCGMHWKSCSKDKFPLEAAPFEGKTLSPGKREGVAAVVFGERPLVTGAWMTPRTVVLVARNLVQVQEQSAQFSRSVVSISLRPHGLQPARLPCPSPTPGACSNSCPSPRWRHPAISSSVFPSHPAFNFPQHQGLFQWVSSCHQVAKVLELQLQYQSFQWVFRTDFP